MENYLHNNTNWYKRKGKGRTLGVYYRERRGGEDESTAQRAVAKPSAGASNKDRPEGGLFASILYTAQ